MSRTAHGPVVQFPLEEHDGLVIVFALADDIGFRCVPPGAQVVLGLLILGSSSRSPVNRTMGCLRKSSVRIRRSRLEK